jgi:hypothetical protein
MIDAGDPERAVRRECGTDRQLRLAVTGMLRLRGQRQAGQACHSNAATD